MENKSIQHTPEPWKVAGFLGIYPKDRLDTAIIATLANNSGAARGVDISEANARRIVACVNACEGLETENLENAGLLRDGLESVQGRIKELKAENERFRNALKEIAKYRHRDKSCSLEAQGYNQVECAEIGAKDYLADIAFEALSETTPTPPRPEPINTQLLEALKLSREIHNWTIETDYPHGYSEALKRIDAALDILGVKIIKSDELQPDEIRWVPGSIQPTQPPHPIGNPFFDLSLPMP